MKRFAVLGAVVLLVLAAAAGSAQIPPPKKIAPKPDLPGIKVLLPDLVVTKIDFQNVKAGTDARGGGYWIFNVLVTVKNQGARQAGPFKVLLERNIGPGGSFQTACLTCEIDVAGLAVSQETTLPARQFNNAMSMASTFRAKVDSGASVAELDEMNNTLTAIYPAVAKPDLTATITFQDITTSTNASGQTVYKYYVAAVIRNDGDGNAGAFDAIFERAEAVVPKAWPMFGDKHIASLAAHTQVTVVAGPSTYGPGQIQPVVRVLCDATHVIDETNEGNNIAMVTFPYHI